MLFRSFKAIGAVALFAVASMLTASQASAQDITSTTSFAGWTYHGNSLTTGIYAAGAKTSDYEIYTCSFISTTSLVGFGTSSGFQNGNRIFGIGIKANSGVISNYTVLEFDPDNNFMYPSPDGITAGAWDVAGSTVGFTGDEGDFIIHFPNGNPTEITIRDSSPTYNASGAFYLPSGGNWGGPGQPAFRGRVASTSPRTFKYFFDLTHMTTEFGPGGTRNANPSKPKLGAFGPTITFSTAAGDTQAVVVASIIPLMVINNNTTLNTALGRRDLILSSSLRVSQPETPLATSIVYSVTTAPAFGTMSASTFTQADINNRLVHYTNTTTATADSVGLTVGNGSTTTSLIYNINIVGGGRADADRDGLTDSFEAVLGTNAANKDGDGDGIEDGVEVGIGTNPLSAASPGVNTDTDGDLIPDAFDASPSNADTNGDRFRDGHALARTGRVNGAVTLGNVNGSGGVDFADGLLILRSFVNLVVLPPDVDQDVNRDGFIDNADGAIIINWFLNNIPLLPFPK